VRAFDWLQVACQEAYVVEAYDAAKHALLSLHSLLQTQHVQQEQKHAQQEQAHKPGAGARCPACMCMHRDRSSHHRAWRFLGWRKWRIRRTPHLEPAPG
jgi:hypothetical protein